MNDNEMRVAALAAAVDGMKAEREWYRSAWLEATAQRERLDFLKQSEDTTARALANCLAALDDMTAERDLAEAALQECSVDERNWNRERDRLEGDLEHANNSLAVAQEDNIELSNELSQARNRIFSLEYSLSQVRKQRDGLLADIYAFALWRADAAGFQPKAAG